MDEDIRRLLIKLLTDPGYRNRLMNDPVHALGEVGLSGVDPATLPSPITLPSDAEILALFVLDPNWVGWQRCQAFFAVLHWT